MAPKKEVVATGGGPAKPLGEDIVSMLRALIAGEGTPEGSLFGRISGRDPLGQTGDIMSGISRLLEPVNVAPTGEALQQIIQRDTERGAADLRSRFGAAGGVSLGTPAAYAESLFRAEAAPRAATAMGELGLKASGLETERIGKALEAMFGRERLELDRLLPILGLAGGLGARGIPQAEESMLVTRNKWLQLLDFITQLSREGGTVAASALAR